MNALLFVTIDALCTSLILIHFMNVVGQMTIVRKSLINLELNKMCFLIMISNNFIGKQKLTVVNRILLYLVLFAIVLLTSVESLTGYVALVVVFPLILIRLRSK